MVLAELKQQHGFMEPEASLPSPAKRKRKTSVSKPNLMLNLTVFILAFSVIAVGLYVHSALLGYEIVALKKDITTLENDNKRIEYTIAELSSLDRVQIEAETKLGMFRPQPQNMVSLLCEPQNATVIHVSDQKTEQQQTASLKKDYQVISSILDRVGITGSF